MKSAVTTALMITLALGIVACADGRQPGDDDLLERVSAMLRQGKIEQGQQALRQHLESNQNDSTARIMLGRVLDYDGRPDEAVQVWEEGLRQGPDDISLLMMIGQLRAQQGRNGPTVTSRRGMVKTEPSRDKAAEEKFQQEHMALAVKTFEQALKLDPDHRQAAVELAAVYSHLKDYEAAVEVWRQLYESNSNDGELAWRFAKSLTEAGQTEEGVKLYEKAIAMNPRLAEAHLALAEYYKAKGDTVAAESSQRQADFYNALPSFTQLTYSAENAAILAAFSDATAVQKLIDDPSDQAADFLAVLCWSHPHNDLETRAFDSLEKRQASALPLVRKLFAEAQSTCTIRSSARILARQKDPGLLERLLRLLPGDTQAMFDMDIAGALGELGDLNAVGPLVEVLNAADRTPENSQEAFLISRKGARVRAALALGKLDNLASRQALEVGLDHPDLAPFCSAALYRLTREAKYMSPLSKTMNGESLYAAHLLGEYLRDVETPEARQLVEEWDKRAKAEKEKREAERKS